MAASITKYEPPLQNNQIRVLVIQPNTDTEARIECSLERTTLTSPCDYTCLSYSCSERDDGIVEYCRTILCEGLEITVTKGAHNAMQHFRLLGGKRLWVDAICIDQTNDGERAQQVSIMAKIYFAAQHVLVWVGDESELGDGELALTCFTGLGLGHEWLEPRNWRDQCNADGLQTLLTLSWLDGRWQRDQTLWRADTDGSSQNASRFATLLRECTERADRETERRYHQATKNYKLAGRYHELLQKRSQKANKKTGSAFNDLDWVIDGIHDDAVITEMPSFSKLEQLYGTELDRVSAPLINYILKFLQRRYFGRRWILQETLSGRSVSMHCGSMYIDFSVFKIGIEQLGFLILDKLWMADTSQDFDAIYRARQISDLRQWRDDLRDLTPMAKESEGPIRHIGQYPIDVMYRFGEFDCSDDRDRVLALISFHEHATIPPDYTITVEETYFRFAKSLLIEQQVGLVLWQAALRAAHVPQAHRTLPSWVADWRNPTNLSMSLWPMDSEGRLTFGLRWHVENRVNSDASLSVKAWLSETLLPGPVDVHFKACPCGGIKRSGLLRGCNYASVADRDAMSNPTAVTHGDVRPGDMMLALRFQGPQVVGGRRISQVDYDHIVVRPVISATTKYQIVGWCTISYDAHLQVDTEPVSLSLV